jgi:hypothetical protein
MRLIELLKLNAPDIMLAAELGLLAQAARQLASSRPVAVAVRG